MSPERFPILYPPLSRGAQSIYNPEAEGSEAEDGRGGIARERPSRRESDRGRERGRGPRHYEIITNRNNEQGKETKKLVDRRGEGAKYTLHLHLSRDCFMAAASTRDWGPRGRQSRPAELARTCVRLATIHDGGGYTQCPLYGIPLKETHLRSRL